MTNPTNPQTNLAPASGGDYSNHPQETRHVIANYRARLAGDHWPAIEHMVRAGVNAVAPLSSATVRNYLAVVTKYVLWVYLNAGYPLDDPTDVFVHHLIRLYARAEFGNEQGLYRHATIARLKHVARALGDDDPREEPTREVNARDPYTVAQIAEFGISARRRSTERRRNNMRVIVALGFGAGLRSREVAAIRPGDIEINGDEAHAHLRGKIARTVPVRREWVNTLRHGLRNRDAEEFAIVGYRNPHKPGRIITDHGIFEPSEPHPSPTRMRATWIIGHLERGLPIDILLQIAGYKDAKSLAVYFNRLHPRPIDDFRAQIIGEVAA